MFFSFGVGPSPLTFCCCCARRLDSRDTTSVLQSMWPPTPWALPGMNATSPRTVPGRGPTMRRRLSPPASRCVNISMGIYICVCVYVYICVFVYIHACTCLSIYTYIPLPIPKCALCLLLPCVFFFRTCPAAARLSGWCRHRIPAGCRALLTIPRGCRALMIPAGCPALLIPAGCRPLVIPAGCPALLIPRGCPARLVVPLKALSRRQPQEDE